MLAKRPRHAVVALNRNRTYSWDEFQNHVGGLCAQLSKCPGGRWLLTCQSSYAFAVGLFALWHTERVAVLAPNQQPKSLVEVAKGVAGLITDSDHSAPRIPRLRPLATSARARGWEKLKLSQTCLELFTSGSTGDRKVVLKNLSMLQCEIAALEATFGNRLRDSAAYSTVSHQHIYGLLFRLLWPLSSARPFIDESVSFWEELDISIARGRSVYLVNSPTHLERISSTGRKALVAAHPRAIFSSGGPLRVSAAAQIREILGAAPIEVFGSTETGGVGWRLCNRTKRSQDWTPLRGVTISVEGAASIGTFRVSSPFVSSADASLIMGDRGIVLPNGKFRIEGRIDRIVKISEKRVSLDDMERRLSRHPWVAETKVVLLHSNDESSRSVLGAAIVLNSKGESQLKRGGRPALSVAFRRHLQKHFDISTLPRIFRFIEVMPGNAQGKVSEISLKSIFQSQFDSAVTMPQRLRETKTNSALRVRYRVPRELAYFEGHFPHYPVVPGIVQIRWVVEAASQWLGSRFDIQRMEAIKFKNLLLPNQMFSLTVDKERSGMSSILRFSLSEKNTLYSSGRLVLA